MDFDAFKICGFREVMILEVLESDNKGLRQKNQQIPGALASLVIYYVHSLK